MAVNTSNNYIQYEMVIRRRAANNAPTENTQTTQTENLLDNGILKKVASYHVIKATATQIAAHEISLVELKTGSSKLQEQAQTAYTLVSKGLGLIESTLVGAKIGGWAGAAIAVGATVVNEGLSLAFKTDEINTKRAAENMSIQMRTVRAGTGGSRGNK